MTAERERLLAGIAALEAQRPVLGDTVVDAAVQALRDRLASAADTARSQLRRQVTVLFLDVVGSTRLSQRLDSEEVHVVLDDVLARCTAIVESHDGRVLQYAGDSLLAVFGAAGSREDDAERAVHAGLALLSEGCRHREIVRERFGEDGFDVRVGVHTGNVLLGGGVDAESSIRGMAVNIAARMEQTAPPGALRISQATYRFVRGAFDCAAQPPLLVKGVDRPVATYLVLRARPRSLRAGARGVEGVATPMVGRARELGLLDAELAALARERSARVALVVGDAGLGKSRLLADFGSRLDSEAVRVFHARADPPSRNQPYGMLRDLVASWLAIGDGDDSAADRRKIEDGIVPLFADEPHEIAHAHAHLLGHLLGFDFAASPHVAGIADDGKQIRTRGLHALAQALRRLHARDGRPLVLLLDDLHFADDGTLGVLRELVQANRDVPMLVVGFTRPTLLERGEEIVAPSASTSRIDLRPLDPAASDELASALLRGLPLIPASLRELLARTAEGNPFFMEELVQMLIDEGAIVVQGDRWDYRADAAAASPIPQTLTGVLQARLDALAPDELRVLQNASVVGFAFWDRALAAFGGDATSALAALARRGLVVARDESAFDGLREYAFKHHILQQVTYETVLLRARRDGHARTADWLAGLPGARAADLWGATAEHYERAGDVANALEFFARAAERAQTRHAHESVLDHVGRALALAGDEPQFRAERWRLLGTRERTWDRLGRRPEQGTDVAALVALAESSGDDAWRGEAEYRRCDHAACIGDATTQASAARRAMEIAREVGSAELRLRAQRRLAGALVLQGDRAAARQMALEGLDEARALGLRALEARYQNTLAFMAGSDDPIELLERTTQELAIDRELGDRVMEAIAMANLSVGYDNVGQIAKARALAADSLRLCRSLGYRALEGVLLNNMAVHAINDGDAEKGLAWAREARDVARELHNPNLERATLSNLCRAALEGGDLVTAVENLERWKGLVPVSGGFDFSLAAASARVALAQGDIAAATRHVDELLAAAGNGSDLSADCALTCFEVLTRTGDARAPAVLAEARRRILAAAAILPRADLRGDFLAKNRAHRAIMAAWDALAGHDPRAAGRDTAHD